MLQQEIIRKAIKERILIIVRWDDIPPFPFTEQIYDQVPRTFRNVQPVHWCLSSRCFVILHQVGPALLWKFPMGALRIG
jgi:hypothetical protein